MPSHTSTDQLADSAQQQLAVLREALESRLATLEEVLADPSRGESLAGLILDLSRIATEEAHATAAQACLATKAEADKQIAELRTSAKAALDAAQSDLRSAQAAADQERAIGVDLRRAADQAQSASQKQSELLATRDQLERNLKGAREQLEAEVARHKTIAAELQQTVSEAQQKIKAEQASARKASAEGAAELAREREALARSERARAELQSALDAERASGAGAREAIERAETRVAVLERDQGAARALNESNAADLARERASAVPRQKELAESRQALAAAQAALQVERTSNADLRQAVEDADQQMTSARSSETQTLANYDVLVAQLEQLRAEVASATNVEASAGNAGADMQRELASARAELEAERTANAALRQAVETADQHTASARSSETQTLANLEQLTAQLNRLRAVAASAADKGAAEAPLRAELDAARTRIGALTVERDTIAVELKAARKWIDDLREAESEFAAASPAGKPPPAAASSPAKHKAKAAEDDDDWQAVRLEHRYVFGKEIPVQINGDPGGLCDLSVTGCQVLSPKALKPNHTVKVTLPNEKKGTNCAGTVMWTRVEPQAAGQPLRYRAGVRFTKADELAIETFGTHHGGVLTKVTA